MTSNSESNANKKPGREFYTSNGRLDPASGPTNVEGEQVEDWGFDGPRLGGVTGVEWTFGCQSVCFATEEDREAARKATGWKDGTPAALSLELPFSDDCLVIHNAERGRAEFFGGWGVI